MKDTEQETIDAIKLEIVRALKVLPPPLMLPEKTLRAQVAIAMPRRPSYELVDEALDALRTDGLVRMVYNTLTGCKYALTDEGRGAAAEV